MAAIQSFAAVSGAQPKVLVLGSIPGVASLSAMQYYAHPRNAFWPIMAAFFGFAPELDYSERLRALTAADVALWDVLHRCERPGSLDSAIDNSTIHVNPIDRWVQQHASVRGILLNGGKAASELRKAFPALLTSPVLQVLPLPSTSPAYAAMPLAAKKTHWHQALASLLSD